MNVTQLNRNYTFDTFYKTINHLATTSIIQSWSPQSHSDVVSLLIRDRGCKHCMSLASQTKGFELFLLWSNSIHYLEKQTNGLYQVISLIKGAINHSETKLTLTRSPQTIKMHAEKPIESIFSRSLWLVGFCHICRGSWGRRHWEMERTQTVFTWIEGTLFTSLYLHSKFMVIHAERNKLWFASVIPLNNSSSWGVMRGRHQVTLLISVLHKKSHSRCCCLFSNISFYELKIIAFVYVFLIAFILFTIQMKKHNLFMCQLEHLPQFDSMRAPHYRHHHYYYYHYKIRIQREIWVCDWISGYALNSGDYA